MEILKTFSETRIRRELGDTKRLYIGDFFNARRRYTYVFLTNKNKYLLEYYPSLQSLEADFLKEISSTLPVDFFEQLIFSAIKLFHFSKNRNIVNQRLSFFFFYTMCTLGSKKKEHMFTDLMYYLQNSESFLERIRLVDKQFLFEGKEIDMFDYSNQYFDFLIRNRSRLEDGEDFSLEELKQLKQFAGQFFNGILNGVKLDGNEFSVTTFFDKYEGNKTLFFQELDNCLDNYRLDYIDNSDHNTSLYSKSQEPNIESPNKTRRVVKKKKVYSEYFIDSYILHFLNKDTLSRDLAFLPIEKATFLKKIILSHSFVRMNEENSKVLELIQIDQQS